MSTLVRLAICAGLASATMTTAAIPVAHAKKKPASPGPKAPPEPTPEAPAGPRMSYVTLVGFDNEPPGNAPRKFVVKSGDWKIAEASGVRGLLGDGSAGKGERALAIYDGACDGDERTLSVRFLPVVEPGDDKGAQAASFVFASRPDGSDLGVTVRMTANAANSTLSLDRTARGKQTPLETIKDVPIDRTQWHSLILRFKGRELTVELDDEERLNKKLAFPVAGKCGLAASAGSPGAKILFDEFKVSIAAAAK